MLSISDDYPVILQNQLGSAKLGGNEIADHSKAPVLFFGRKTGIAHDLFLKRLADFPTDELFCRIWVS
jgi:hypothetical protein